MGKKPNENGKGGSGEVKGGRGGAESMEIQEIEDGPMAQTIDAVAKRETDEEHDSPAKPR
mgnify:CR=1 FL=1